MAKLTETFVGAVAPHLQKTGRALKVINYTVVKATANDTVTCGDFTQLVDAFAAIIATGTTDLCVISTNTTNMVTLAGASTGTSRLTVIGY